MTPPNIPPFKPADSVQAATIIVEALTLRGYKAAIYVPLSEPEFDFDIQVLFNNVVVASRRKNRSYLTVTWEKKELRFAVFGHRWGFSKLDPKADYDIAVIDLSNPQSMDQIADLILKVVTEDKYHYPFL